jgi:Meiotically up-regulated gene 113
MRGKARTTMSEENEPWTIRKVREGVEYELQSDMHAIRIYIEALESVLKIASVLHREGTISSMGEREAYKHLNNLVYIADHPLVEYYTQILENYGNKLQSPEPGFNYLMNGVGTNFYKIGKSNDPIRRMGEVQRVIPYKLKIVHTIETINMTYTEDALHRLCRKFRRPGEWFELDQKWVNRICSIISFVLYDDSGWMLDRPAWKLKNGTYIESLE